MGDNMPKRSVFDLNEDKSLKKRGEVQKLGTWLN